MNDTKSGRWKRKRDVKCARVFFNAETNSLPVPILVPGNQPFFNLFLAETFVRKSVAVQAGCEKVLPNKHFSKISFSSKDFLFRKRRYIRSL